MECLKSHVRFITVSLPIFWPRNIYPCFKLRKMVIFICCFSKQATLRNCETQTVQCTQTQVNLFAFYLNQILTILFEFSLTISLFYCKRRKYLRNFQKLVLPGQYVNHHNRKVGKMLFSNFYKTEKQSHKFY